MMLPIAWLAAKISGATLEYLPHELEIERTGLEGIMKKLTIFIENLFIKSARNIVVVCDPIKDWYEKTYDLNNIYVVRNAPERKATGVKNIQEGDKFRTKFNIPETAKIFIYQGQFSMGRGIEFLLEAFSEIDSSKCHLVLMGFAEGDYQSLIDKAVEKHSNIHYQPAVSRDMIVSYSACADVGIFITEKVSLCDALALPNKFLEWAHAGLPVLVSKNYQYQASILEKEGFGWSIEFDELKKNILTIVNSDLSSFQDNAISYARNAVWEKDAKIFSEVYKPKSKK